MGGRQAHPKVQLLVQGLRTLDLVSGYPKLGRGNPRIERCERSLIAVCNSRFPLLQRSERRIVYLDAIRIHHETRHKSEGGVAEPSHKNICTQKKEMDDGRHGN